MERERRTLGRSARDERCAPADRGQPRVHLRLARSRTFSSLATDQAAELLGAEKAILMLTDDDGLAPRSRRLRRGDEVVERFRESFDESLVSASLGLLGADSRGVHWRAAGGAGKRHRAARGRAPERDARSREYADDEWLLSALADQTAAPLENAQLAEAARARATARGQRAALRVRARARGAEGAPSWRAPRPRAPIAPRASFWRT